MQVRKKGLGLDNLGPQDVGTCEHTKESRDAPNAVFRLLERDLGCKMVALDS